MKKIKTIKKHNWFIRLLKKILRTFGKDPKLIQTEKILPETAIYISNHSGAAGPIKLSIYFPKILVPWGAHPMTEWYPSRWKYLYHIFYRKKLHYSKFKSFMLATTFGIISKTIYKGVYLIPTYPNVLLKKTIKQSIEHLNVNNNLLIFPEDSDNGYLEEIESFHAGFIYLAQRYYKENKVHIPIIPLHFNKVERIIIVGNSYTLEDFSEIVSRDEIANKFRLILNNLPKINKIAN